MSQQPLDFTGPFEFDASAMAIAPSVHPEAKEASAVAAMDNAQSGRKVTQNAAILKLLKAAGERGLTDLELRRLTGYPPQTICARRGFDLKPLLETAGRRDGFTVWRLK